MKSTLKRKILSAAIAVTIVFQTVSPVILATDNPPIEIAQEPANLETTCPHHVHDENCGFRQEASCSHLHDDSCYQEITKCLHQHSEVCYPVLDGDTLTDDNPQEPTECTHICEEETGCLTRELSCQHLHDTTCGYAEGSACSFDLKNCDICTPTPQIGESDMSESFVQSTFANLAETGEVYGVLTSAGLFKANADGSSTGQAVTENKTITHLFVDGSVEAIGDENVRFYTCTNLKTVDLSGATNLKSINGGAFYICRNLETINFSGVEKLESIGNAAFDGCRKLTTVDLSEATNLTSIGGSVFQDCPALTSIALPSSLTTIGENTFSGCIKLETINVDENNKIYSSENGVLIDKSKKTLIQYPLGKTDVTYAIPSSVMSIGANAFAYSTSLETLDFSNAINLTSIGENAFTYCKSLKKLDFSDAINLTLIKKLAFRECPELSSVTISSGVISIGVEAFYNCPKLETVDLSGATSLTSISNQAFSYCTSLETVDLSGATSLTSIGNEAFLFCESLTSITIPNSVTSIRYSAFYSCTNLKTVTFKGEKPPQIGEDIFDNCGNNLKIYVPNSRVSAYEKALSDYKNKIVKYKAETEFAGGVKTYKDTVKETEFIYGETITVKVTPKQTMIQQQALRMAAPTTDQIALFIDEMQITKAKNMISGQEETFTIDTKSKIIPAKYYTGEQNTTITAKYVGNEDMANAEASVTITLKPKELTATVKEGATATKVYDGTSNFNNVKLTLVDVESDDTVTAIADGVSDNADAGTRTFTATNVTLDGADKDWYSLAPTSVSGNVNIKKADTDSENGVVVGKTALIYGDTLTVEYTPKAAQMAKASVANTAQLYYGDVPLNSVTNPNNGKYTMTYDTNHKDIPISANIPSGENGLHIKFGGNSNLNEQIILVKGVSLSKRALTGTIVGNVNKNYDGTNDFTNIPLTLNGVENGDTVTASANGKSANANAGTKAFTATSVTLSGEDRDWYSLATTSVRGQVTINKVAYTGTTSATARVYESGQVGATVTLPTLPGGAKYGKPSASGAIIMTNMSVTGTTLTYTAPASKVGQTGIITIPVTGATNYKDFNIIITVTSIANVKKQQEISYAAAEVTKIYGDEKFTNPLTETIVNGSITYESNDTNIATVDSATGEVTIVGAGTATITATASETSTYTQATASYSVTIGKKALTLRAEDKSMVKGEAMPIFTYVATGLVNGDTITAPPTMTTTTDGNKAGTFEISITGGTMENNSSYEITYIKGTLTVVEKFYPVTVIDGTSDKEQASEGETITITAIDRNGYTFKNWSSADVSFTNSTAKITTFIMPAKAVTVTANYSKNSDSSSGGNNSGDGGNSSNGNNPDSGTTTTTSSDKTEVITTTEPTVSEGTVKIDLSTKIIQNSLIKGQIEAKRNNKSGNEIVVVVKAKMIPTTANNLTIHLPKKLIDILVKAKVKEFRIEDKIANISFNLDMLKEMKKQIGTDIDITAKKIDNKTLSQESRNIVGSRPVYEFGITGTNGKKLTDFGAGRVSISIPYTLRKDEKVGNLHAYHIDSQGKITKIPNSEYNAVSKRLNFITNHFSMFAVGYK